MSGSLPPYHEDCSMFSAEKLAVTNTQAAFLIIYRIMYD